MNEFKEVEEFFKPFDLKAHTLINHLRETKGSMLYQSKDFVFGQIYPSSFANLLSNVVRPSDRSFVDLGSGLGKAVMITSLLYPQLNCLGIEYIEPLAELSREISNAFKEKFAPENTIEMVCGDLFDFDLSQVDLVWVSATCFQNDSLDQLYSKLTQMKKGARVMSLSHRLHKNWRLIGQAEYRMEWNREGEGTFVHSYERI